MRRYSSADIWKRLALLFVIGGVLLAFQQGSCWPLVPVLLALWVLLLVANRLGRR